MPNPYDPLTRLELALVGEARGNVTAAVEHLEAALGVWANADPEFKPVAEARTKLEELRGGS